jgi:hypothetical protein
VTGSTPCLGSAQKRSRRRCDLAGDRGSTIPLVLGFYLIALLLVAAAVVAGELFNRQRELQSVCDGAAVAAANAIDAPLARAGELGDRLPLLAVQNAVGSYLARDPGRAAVQAAAELGPDGRAVRLACTSRARVAFGGLIGRADGIEQHASAAAEGRIG